MNKDLADIARELQTLKNRRKILKAILDDLDSKINQAEAQIEEKMIAAGVQSFVSNNIEYIMKETLSVSIIKDCLPNLVCS
jgi:uncharacterized protein YlxP (DUF503 family)